MALHRSSQMRGLLAAQPSGALAPVCHHRALQLAPSSARQHASPSAPAPCVASAAVRRAEPGAEGDQRAALAQHPAAQGLAGGEAQRSVGSLCCAGLAAAALVLAPALSLLDAAPAHAAMATMAQQQRLLDNVPVPDQQEAALRAEEARYDENLMTAELRSFLELLDRKGSSVKAEDLAGPRAKVRVLHGMCRCSCVCALGWGPGACVPELWCARAAACALPQLGFRRAADGRVSLRAQDGTWFNVKADMQASSGRRRAHMAQWQHGAAAPACCSSNRCGAPPCAQAPGFLLLRSEADGSMFFLPPDDAGQILQVCRDAGAA